MNARQSNTQAYRIFNVKAFIFLLVGAVATVGGVYGLHEIQVRRSADKMKLQAEKAESEGRLEDAVRSFSNYMAMRPKDRDAQAKFGRSLAKTAKTGLQRKMAADTLANSAGIDAERSDDLLQAADLYNQLGLFDEAAESADVVLRNKPNDANALYHSAYSQISKKEFDKADKLLIQAHEADPKLLKAYLLQADLVRRHLSEAHRATTIMDTMVAKNPDSAEAHLRRGTYRLALQLEGAEADIDIAEKLDPKVEGLQMARIDQQVRARKFEEAIKLCRKAIEEHPDQISFPSVLARLESQLGKPADAVKTLEAALEKFPDARDLAFSLADNQILVDKLKDAKVTIEKLREVRFPDGPLLFLDGAIASREGDWDLAVQKFEQAGDKLSGFPEIESRNSLALGICYERVNLLDKALESFRKARAITGSPVITNRIAGVLNAQKKYKEAALELQQLSTTVPGLGVKLQQLQTSINSTLQQPETGRNWLGAERIVAEIAKDYPKAVEAVLAKVEVLSAQGKNEEAIAKVEEAKAAFPKEISLYVAKSNLYQLQGKYDSAQEELNKAPVDVKGAIYLRLAKIDFWAKRGGSEAPAELDKSLDKISTFPEVEQNLIYESLVGANLKLGRLEKASEQLKFLLTRQPDRLGLRLLQVDLAERMNSEPAISEAIAQMRRLEGNRGVSWREAEIRLHLAKAAKGDRGELPEVDRLLVEIKDVRPDLPTLPRYRSAYEELSNRSNQAIAPLEQAIKTGSRSPIVIRRYIQLLADQGRFGEADRQLRQLESTGSLDPETKKLAAELALRSQNKVRAAELIRSAVPPSSLDTNSLRWKGRFLLLSDPSPAGRAEAKASFIQATTVDPASADCWLALMEFLVSSGEPSEALAAYNKATPLVSAPQKLFFDALANQILGRLDTAKASFEKLLKERPDDNQVMRASAAFFQKIEQFRTSEKLWRALIQKGQQISATEMHDARIALAELLSKTGNPRDAAEALELIDANLSLQPKSLRDRRAKIDILSRQPGGRKEAIALLQDLNTTGEPLAPAERIRLAQLLADDKDWDAARREMTALLGSPMVTSDSIAVYVRMLLKHAEPADLVEAEKWINSLKDREPTSLVPLEMQARWLVASKREKEAVDLIDSIGKANPKLPLVAAEAAERINLLEPAERYFKAAAALPGNPNAPIPLALFYGRHKRHKEALDLIEKLKGISPAETVGAAAVMTVDNVKSDREINTRVAALLKTLVDGNPSARKSQLPLMLAVMNTRIENYDASEKIYRDILKNEPNDIATMNNLAWMFAVKGKAKEALPMIEDVINRAGPSPKFVDTRGMVQLGLGQTAAAIDDFRDAIAGRPDDLPAVYFHLALAQHAANQDKDAKESIELAQKTGLTAEYLETPERIMYEDLLKKLALNK